MAFSKGHASKEAVEFKRYIGVCPVTVKAVNPNKKEFESLFGTTLEDAPEYVQEKEDNEGNPYKSVRVSIIFKPKDEKMPLITMPFFITSQKNKGRNSGKYQITDKYGRFTWATEEEIKNKEIPTFSNGNKASIDKDYRIAYVGEEDLTRFIRAFLNIPNPTKWNNDTKKYEDITDPKELEDCEGALSTSDIENMLKGDFSSIKDYIAYQPTNIIKVCLGVRTDINSGKLYQTVYTKMFIPNNVVNYKGLERELQRDLTYYQSSGKTPNTEYSSEKVHEYTVTPTTFEENQTVGSEELTSDSELPFGDTNSYAPW